MPKSKTAVINAIIPKLRTATRKGGVTKDRILDAAEKLFAERGFTGTTMRDIAIAAPVELGSLSYHFASKEEIFDVVLRRRSKETTEATRHALDAVMAEKGDRLTIEDVLTAFAETTFRPIALNTPGWMNYSRLVMQRLAIESDGQLHPAISANYLPVRRRYLSVLRKLMPAVPIREVEWCFAMFESSFGSMLFGFTAADGKQQLATGAKLEQLRRNLIPFCAAGFHKLEAFYTQLRQERTPAKKTRQKQSGNHKITRCRPA